MLSAEDTLAMIEVMAGRAEADAERESPDRDDSYWDGWAHGLRTLAGHIKSGVRADAFPRQSDSREAT